MTWRLPKKWYIEATGIHPYFDQPFYAGFNINDCELGLDPDMSNAVPGNQSVAYWEVANLADVINKLADRGAVVVQPKTNVGGEIHVAVVRDPFGNYVGLIEGA